MAVSRLLFILLLIVNLLVFAAGQGWLGVRPPVGEPERLAHQLHPERIRFAGDTTVPPSPEPAVAAVAEAAQPAQAEETQNPTPPPAQVCVAWSGLAGDEANRLLERLRAAGMDTRRSTTEVPSAWWVRLPPQGGREQAERKLKELRALGVTDFFIVQDAGPNQFAISLGLFKTETAANQQLAQLRAKGVRSAGIATRSTQQHRIEAEAAGDRLAAFTDAANAADPRLIAARGECKQ